MFRMDSSFCWLLRFRMPRLNDHVSLVVVVVVVCVCVGARSAYRSIQRVERLAVRLTVGPKQSESEMGVLFFLSQRCNRIMM